MIELKPFTEDDFDTLKNWATNPSELFQFAGPIFSYPLTDDQLKNYLEMKDKKPLKVILKTTNETIGHCELNYENGNHRLSRILIGKKNLRGKRIGQQIVREMAKRFFQDPNINKVDLNTFEWNKAAINCYKKVGFKINKEKSDTMTVIGNEWTRINMSLNRNEMSEDGIHNEITVIS